MELSKDVSEESVQDRCNIQAPNKACTLIYTVSYLIIKPKHNCKS